MLNLHLLECTLKGYGHISDLLLAKYWVITGCKYPLCNSLVTINIPQGVKIRGSNPFFDSHNVKFSGPLATEDGKSLVIDGKLISFSPGTTDLISYIIPEGITSIGMDAFRGCDNLTYVELPESLIDIVRNPFTVCPRLTFGGKFASADGRYLVKDGVLISFSPGTYQYYTPIEYVVPEGITSIGDYAFYNCFCLKSITLPKSLLSVGNFAFANILWLYRRTCCK